MEDFTEKLSELLASPDGMARIQNVANSLMGELGGQKEEADNTQGNMGDISSALGDIVKNLSGGGNPLEGILPDGIDPAIIMKAFSALQGSGNDNRTKLLLALRPSLGAERQKKLDNAVKILKLLSIMPLITEHGLL